MNGPSDLWRVVPELTEVPISNSTGRSPETILIPVRVKEATKAFPQALHLCHPCTLPSEVLGWVLKDFLCVFKVLVGLSAELPAARISLRGFTHPLEDWQSYYVLEAF